MEQKKQPENLLRPFWQNGVFLFILSGFINVLGLVGSIYMLLVYSQVLTSESIPTLVALTAIAIVLLAFYGVFDNIRTRIGSRIGASMQNTLDQNILKLNRSHEMALLQKSLKDTENLRRFFASPVVFALMDIIWTPIFIIVSIIFHPLLGIYSISAIVILTIIAIFNQKNNKQKTEEAEKPLMQSEMQAREFWAHSETIQALGMQDRLSQQWQEIRKDNQILQLGIFDENSFYGSLSKTLRLIAQSGILGLGAYLVIYGELMPGAMIAASILLGRALAPFDMVVNQWSSIVQSRLAYQNLSKILQQSQDDNPDLRLPRPKGVIGVEELVAFHKMGQKPILQNINFSLSPGQALGIIGESGSGKTSIAKAICGLMDIRHGRITIDGANIAQYSPSDLGSYLGYLPQEVNLLSGTIAENISRFDFSADRDQKIIHAAKRAGAHDMIVNFENGYNTLLPASVSGGEKQRIALARAIYGEPPIMIFDEANSNLDSHGTLALNQAIRALKKAGKTIIIIAHRPAAIQECDLILVLDQGRQKAFGERDAVLKAQLQNHAELGLQKNGNK